MKGEAYEHHGFAYRKPLPSENTHCTRRFEATVILLPITDRENPPCPRYSGKGNLEEEPVEGLSVARFKLGVFSEVGGGGE